MAYVNDSEVAAAFIVGGNDARTASTSVIVISGRREAMRVCALATGLADKAVSLFYEGAIHKRETQVWVDRCRSQIAGCLRELERSRGSHVTAWWFGGSIGHADIAVACALRFLGDAHPGLFDVAEGWPLLAAHAAKCEALDVFGDIQQAFKVTLPK